MIAVIYYYKHHVHRNHIVKYFINLLSDNMIGLLVLNFLRKGCQVGRDQDKIDANCCIFHDYGVTFAVKEWA